ncbi:zinc finger protein 837 [Pteropus alecto]|uniref:zinc finger protein 837 n=1 Tax=Pteropus alecto TaxID=9402 RepID=UPI000D536634|nr:zinc finger protein 837 [Pteropus alecto]
MTTGSTEGRARGDYIARQSRGGPQPTLKAEPTSQCSGGPEERERLCAACGDQGTCGPPPANPIAAHRGGGWLGMEAGAPNYLRGSILKADPPETDRGQEERPKTEPRPPAEALAQRCPSQEGDLHGWTGGGRTTPPDGDSQSWGFCVQCSPKTRQSAGAGRPLQELRGLTPSQDPDLVTPQRPHPAEGPCWSPAGARPCSHNRCLARHRRAPLGEELPVGDHRAVQASLWRCPQRGEVHADCPWGTGAQPFPSRPEQSALAGPPGACGRAFSHRSNLNKHQRRHRAAP